MTDHLRLRPASTDAMLTLFSDERTIAYALSFEAALAAAEAAEGIISATHAIAIEAACDGLVVRASELGQESAHAGTLAIPLVARLRAAVPDEAVADVHRGATSQDLADTVLMLQARDGASLLLVDARRTIAALDRLARHHAERPVVGRTLLQDALPIGLGLRFAQWSAGIAECSARLEREVGHAARLQFGGAVGTRHGLQGRGAGIAKRMAATLRLADSPPWHARRDGPVAVGATVAMLIGAVGKMARDVSLLAQNAIGELHEPLVPGRGGSSAMAHKRNPTSCQTALSAATRAPGLVASLLAAMPQELERGLGGWQAEGPVLADLFLLAAGSVAAMADVAEGLEIDVAVAEDDAPAGSCDDIGESAAIVAQLLASRSGDR